MFNTAGFNDQTFNSTPSFIVVVAAIVYGIVSSMYLNDPKMALSFDDSLTSMLVDDRTLALTTNNTEGVTQDDQASLLMPINY